jgi:hypothetical protein
LLFWVCRRSCLSTLLVLHNCFSLVLDVSSLTVSSISFSSTVCFFGEYSKNFTTWSALQIMFLTDAKEILSESSETHVHQEQLMQLLCYILFAILSLSSLLLLCKCAWLLWKALVDHCKRDHWT